MDINVFSHFKSGAIIEMDEHHVTFRQRLQGGRGTAAVYPVIPGIEVALLEFKAARYFPGVHKEGRIIEINHCLAGRIESRMGDGLMQYASAGDLVLNSLHNHSDSIELPTGYYKGAVVMLDIDTASQSVPQYLPSLSVPVDALAGKFFSDRESFIVQAKDEVQRIFADIYTAPKHVRTDYYRLKALELLIYLSCIDSNNEPQGRIYSSQQVELVKKVHQKLTEKLDTRFTIDELAREYCISPTALKSYFKGVYGRPISAYMKEYRIRHAATLLRKTDLPVSEVAAAVGYESQSNFGSVFKELIGETPIEYRKKFEY